MDKATPIVINSLERLKRTERIWYLPSLTRQDAVSMLANKEEGNFLVRSSQEQKNSLALSVSSQGHVQHFKIQSNGSCLLLEDSELQFDSIFSLIFHYTQVCEELPTLLCLPDILTSTESTQHLDALALLSKDFWNYPMSKPGRRSLCIPDMQCGSRKSYINFIENSDIIRNSVLSGEGEEEKEDSKISDNKISDTDARNKISQEFTKISARLTSQLAELNVKRTHSITPGIISATPVRKTFPPRPPRRSCGRLDTPTSSPLATPPCRQRRRASDSVCVSPLVNKIQSGDFTRERKQSVFVDRLSIVEESVKSWNSHLNGEADTALLTKAIQKVTRNRQLNETDLLHEPLEEVPTKKEEEIENFYTECIQNNKDNEDSDDEGDYAEPMDRLDNAIAPVYSDPTKEIHEKKIAIKTENDNCDRSFFCSEAKEEKMSIRKQRFSDSGILYGHKSEVDRRGRRKISMGDMVKRLSQGKICIGEKNLSTTELRFSTVIERLITGPKNLGKSHQVDSSSWEFLNKDDKENVSNSSTSDKSTDKMKTKNKTIYEDGKNVDQVVDPKEESSSDSMYESEYQSSESSSLTRNTDSAFSSLTPPDTCFNDQVVLPCINLQRSSEWSPIRSCVRGLTQRKDTLFGRSVHQFIVCTKVSKVMDPLVVLRNIRQFLNGLRNYLVRWGESELNRIMQEERRKLRSDEFLDISHILEDELYTVVVQPLAAHLDMLFRQEFSQRGKDIITKSGIDMSKNEGVGGNRVPPIYLDRLPTVVQACKNSYCSLLCSSCPRDKLRQYLSMVSSILTIAASQQEPRMSVEAFTSILCHVLVQLGPEKAEMESELLWGILPQSLLSGESGYYLSLLSSAVNKIKSKEQLIGTNPENVGTENSNISRRPATSLLVSIR